MAKKVVATLKDKGKVQLTKVIIPYRSPKTGYYAFTEAIVPETEVQAFIKNNTPS